MPTKLKKTIDLGNNKNYTNKEIAGTLGISVKTAENSFKEKYNITIHQYLLKRKIEEAKFYLANFPEMKVGEIALNLGFYDEFHLSRQFKKSAGVSPTDYRKSKLSVDNISCP